MRTALRTLVFLPPSWGRLSRPLSDISLIWSAQEPRPMGTGTSRRVSPVPPQLPPRALLPSPIPAQLPPRTRPPSVLQRPATPSAVLPLPLSPRDGKGEGGTTVGTVGTVTVPQRPPPFPPPPPSSYSPSSSSLTVLSLIGPQCSGSGKEFGS
ncbi:hypothetical protein PAMP_011463 [Pampus punctatissimus]